LDKWNLDNNSNELIPNYSITLDNLLIDNDMSSEIVAVNDNLFVSAIQSASGDVNIVSIMQDFVDDDWGLSSQVNYSIGSGMLMMFGELREGYGLGYINDSDEFRFEHLDDAFNIVNQSQSFNTFIDTTYNGIDSLKFLNFTHDTITNEILLCGRVHTQGTNFSCILRLDENLDPLWFKTYFENCEIVDVVNMDADNFLLLNKEDDGGTDLIMDNLSGSSYKKYNLSSDDLFFGFQSLESDGILFLSGIENDVARTIEVDLNSNSAFVVDVEVYPVSDFRALFLSRDNIVTAGIQNEGGDNILFASELESLGSIWCNRYIDEQYVKILDLIELPGKGILISAIVESQGAFRIHLVRVDEEGATFINEFSENCI
jgi:hypothetical protein